MKDSASTPTTERSLKPTQTLQQSLAQQKPLRTRQDTCICIPLLLGALVIRADFAGGIVQHSLATEGNQCRPCKEMFLLILQTSNPKSENLNPEPQNPKALHFLSETHFSPPSASELAGMSLPDRSDRDGAGLPPKDISP